MFYISQMKIRKWDVNGYVVVKATDVVVPERFEKYSSMFTKQGRVYEHRIKLALSIGRPLAAGEIVHHINGKRSDNRISNLELYKSRHTHGADHKKLLKMVADLRSQIINLGAKPVC